MWALEMTYGTFDALKVAKMCMKWEFMRTLGSGLCFEETEKYVEKLWNWIVFLLTIVQVFITD